MVKIGVCKTCQCAFEVHDYDLNTPHEEYCPAHIPKDKDELEAAEK